MQEGLAECGRRSEGAVQNVETVTQAGTLSSLAVSRSLASDRLHLK